jgi:hypothetical protein
MTGATDKRSYLGTARLTDAAVQKLPASMRLPYTAITILTRTPPAHGEFRLVHPEM